MDAENWHIPLREDGQTINRALCTMDSFKLNQEDVPFIIRLFENPKYNLFPGSVTLEAHDIIHVLLGRGLLPKDEAFVILFASIKTSSKLVIPRSGIPYEAAATPLPDKYIALC